MRAVGVLALFLALAATAAAMPDAVRRPAPALSGTSFDGKAISLAAMRGRPVFINVWSSW